MRNALIFANFLWSYTNYMLYSECRIVISRIIMLDRKIFTNQCRTSQNQQCVHITPARLGSQEPKHRILSTTPQNMVGIAKSQALKSQIFRKEVDDLKVYAVKLYTTEQERSLAPGEKKSHCAKFARTRLMHTMQRQADVFLWHTTHWPDMEKEV
jgi:hypothetical protein